MADTTAGGLVRRFYELRREGKPDLLRPLLAVDVVWREPTVGAHMGELIGPDAVIDMIGRALATTAGSLSLEVSQLIETATHCAAVIDWSARKPGGLVRGRELAVFGIRGGRIASAQFLAENLADDHAFWGEPA